MGAKPHHLHDCSGCVFIATYSYYGVLHDLYYHPNSHDIGATMVSRNGNGYLDYLSCIESRAICYSKDHPLRVAFQAYQKL